MGLEFEWHAGTDDGEWETLARTGRRSWFQRLRRVPLWIWVVVAVGVGLAGTGGFFWIRQRYEAANRQVAFQIQTVIDLEARAAARGDVELVLAQQDREATDWYAQQEGRMRTECAPLPQDPTLRYQRCAPVSPAKVQRVEVRGQVARVEVLEAEDTVRRARFYRQTELGWKQTAPRDEFFALPVELRYGSMTFRYHRRDEPYVTALVERTHQIAAEICPVVGCPAADKLRVNFAVNVPFGQPPQMNGGELLIASPWIDGIPADGDWDELDLQGFTNSVTQALAYHAMRAHVGELNPLQRAILAEYVAWYSHQDTGRAPILGRVIAQRGQTVLPEVLGYLRSADSLGAFVSRWLALWPTGQEVAYFQTLIDIEYDAVRLGLKDTFMLLQDSSRAWQERQEAWFDTAQESRPALPRVEVSAVRMGRGSARVTLKRPVLQVGGQGTSSLDSVVFYRLRDGDWKRTGSAYALDDVPGDASPTSPPATQKPVFWVRQILFPPLLAHVPDRLVRRTC